MCFEPGVFLFQMEDGERPMRSYEKINENRYAAMTYEFLKGP